MRLDEAWERDLIFEIYHLGPWTSLTPRLARLPHIDYLPVADRNAFDPGSRVVDGVDRSDQNAVAPHVALSSGRRVTGRTEVVIGASDDLFFATELTAKVTTKFKSRAINPMLIPAVLTSNPYNTSTATSPEINPAVMPRALNCRTRKTPMNAGRNCVKP